MAGRPFHCQGIRNRVNAMLSDAAASDDSDLRNVAHVGTVLIVHLALATVLAHAERFEGTYGTMRLSPIAKKLRELLQEPPPGLEAPSA